MGIFAPDDIKPCACVCVHVHTCMYVCMYVCIVYLIWANAENYIDCAAH